MRPGAVVADVKADLEGGPSRDWGDVLSRM
jgi:hypothetical protein